MEHVEIFVSLEQMLRIREQQHTASVVIMQMRIHDDLDVIGGQALACQCVQNILVATLCRTVCPSFSVDDIVLMDTGVDKDVSVVFLQKISAVNLLKSQAPIERKFAGGKRA